MDEQPERQPHVPPSDWAVPIADWRNDVARSRERIVRLQRVQRDTVDSANLEAIRELGVTVEALTVAEEELRAQNEELVRIHHELYQERARYRTLFDRAPAPYLVTDTNGLIANANAAASELLGVRSDRLVGKPISVFVENSSRRGLRRVVNACNAPDSAATTIALNLVPRGGAAVRVEATVVQSHDGGDERAQIAWLLVDQTERLRREEADRQRATDLEQLVAERTSELQRAQYLKDQLIATVSHEFRTALGAIGGYAELLALGLRGPLTSEQSGDIGRIQRAYDHLARLVDDLLSYNKIVAGQITLDVDDVSLADALRGITDLVGPQAAASGAILENQIAKVEAIVRTDPERLRQIILNLLANAVKFSSRGAAIRLSAEEMGANVLVRVRDTGPGIPRDKLEFIFEPFARLDGSEEVSGSGLGLAISREMARAIGADLTVTSELGQGTCFTLALPISTRLASKSA